MKENRTLEFKADVTNTFLKTVSAYSNFGTGEIIFGINDDGSVYGIDNPEKVCLNLENKINDSINPKPEYSLSVNQMKKTITLTVFEGKYKPYLYKGKAYRRSDSATIEVDQLELKRLTLEGSNLYYEGLPNDQKKFTFNYFEKKLKERLGISELTEDMLRTFGFLVDERYNNAAALFSDSNTFYGIDAARFGETINIINDRETFSGTSILEQYDHAVNMYAKYYQYEEISGIERKTIELIPERAFREAVANALVHRTWDINSNIRIFMYPDRVEVFSPGGLPKGITKEEYLTGMISNLRNPIIGNVFFRLKYIEMFGTGIHRIKDAYKDNSIQPQFEITENSIKVVLPIMNYGYQATKDEQCIIDLLSGGRVMSSREIAEKMNCGKDKAIRLLHSLEEKNYIKVLGSGRGTKYSIK